jgi:hypothetical protein
MERFTLTLEHVALLKRMCVEWQDEPYDGAPAINIKRPYGNSSVWQDVAEIIGLQPAEDDDGEKHWPKGTRERCMALHRETETALQVCLTAQTFEPGDYVTDAWLRKWRRA